MIKDSVVVIRDPYNTSASVSRLDLFPIFNELNAVKRFKRLTAAGVPDGSPLLTNRSLTTILREHSEYISSQMVLARNCLQQ